MLGSSQVAAQLVASQVALSSIELGSYLTGSDEQWFHCTSGGDGKVGTVFHQMYTVNVFHLLSLTSILPFVFDAICSSAVSE
jgi:hypothetical protein